MRCIVCGGPTNLLEKKKGFGSSPLKSFSCLDDSCGSVLIQEYDYKTKELSEKIFLDRTKRTDSDIWKRYKYIRLLPDEIERIVSGERLHSLEQKVLEPDICEGCKRPTGQVIELGQKKYCWNCAKTNIEALGSGIMATTSSSFEGYKIIKYLDIESVESIWTPGFFGATDARITDSSGTNNATIEEKLNAAKKYALALLKSKARAAGGNALIGVQFDYKEFFVNYVGVVVNGTIVRIESLH